MRARATALTRAARRLQQPSRPLGSAAPGGTRDEGAAATAAAAAPLTSGSATAGVEAQKAPLMPEEHECCGNDCGEDCVWFIYFEDHKRYLDSKRKR